MYLVTETYSHQSCFYCSFLRQNRQKYVFLKSISTIYNKRHLVTLSRVLWKFVLGLYASNCSRYLSCGVCMCYCVLSASNYAPNFCVKVASHGFLQLISSSWSRTWRIWASSMAVSLVWSFLICICSFWRRQRRKLPFLTWRPMWLVKVYQGIVWLMGV